MKKLSDNEFNGIVGSLIRDGISYVDDELSPKRAFATEYYQGELTDLESDEGRSSMVSRDVRDVVQSILPSVMRVFTSTEKVVEYVPRNPEDVDTAEQATDYANYLLMQENDGFSTLYAIFKDSLVRSCGFAKVYYEEKETSRTQPYTGIDQQQLDMLMMEEGVEVEVIEESQITIPTQSVDPQTNQPITVDQPQSVFSVKVTKYETEGKVKVEEVPPEEVLLHEADKYIGESFVGHRRLVTVSDLVEMGYKYEDVIDFAGQGEFDDNDELLARSDDTDLEPEINNPAMRKVLYIEAYCKVDRNGDGIAEMLKVCCIGTGYEVVDVEEVDFHPFVAFPCDPEPHLSPVESYSIADDVIDIQRLKSAIWRNSLDSLAQAINPRTVILEGRVEAEDLLNNEVGAIIRARDPQAVIPLVTPDMSASGLQMLAYADEVREARTGISRAAQGLDADALKSTATNAANAIVTATQSRIELVTRLLANGMRDLFKLLLKVVTVHQDKPQVIRLRNEWVQVDPRHWNAGMDVTVNVALGTGTTAERFGFLQMIAQKQEMIIQMMGPSNPVVGLSQYSQTLSKMAELAGFKNASMFINQLPPDFQMPPPPPQQDPNAQAAQMLAQVEQQKAQMKMQVDQAKMQLESQKAQMKAQMDQQKIQLDREQAQADMARKQLELQMMEAKMVAELRIKEAEATLKNLVQMKNLQGDNDAMQNANEEKAEAEGQLAQAIAMLGQLVASGNESVAQAMTMPKSVIRDESGRVIGVQTSNPSAMEGSDD